VHLIERELKGLRNRGAETRLLVTTVFSTTSPATLARATDRGVSVRFLNPGGGSTYHPNAMIVGETDEALRYSVSSSNDRLSLWQYDAQLHVRQVRLCWAYRSAGANLLIADWYRGHQPHRNCRDGTAR